MNFKELRFENSILALLLSFFLCLNGTASHARPGSFNTNDWQTSGTAERNFEFNALRITFLHNEVVAWSIVQDKDESTPIETNVRFMFHQAKPIMNFDGVVIAPMIKGGSLGKPKESFSLRPISDLKILGEVEGPRDINMFKVEPTVMDERPFFSPGIPVKPCFWSWEQRP